MLDSNVMLELIRPLALLAVIISCGKISIYYFKKIMLDLNFSEQKKSPKKVIPKKKNNLEGFDMSNENYYDKKRNRRIL